MRADAESPETAGAGPSLTTGRRVFLALATLVCGFGLALVFTSAGLRKVERALAGIRVHEHRMRLSLELESSVRDLYAHQANVVGGVRAQIRDYVEARERAVEVERELASQVDDEEERGWVGDAVRSAEELDRIARERMAEALQAGRRASGSLAQDRLSSLVSRVEADLDHLLARQHSALVAVRSDVSAQLHATFRRLLVLFFLAALFSAAIGWYIHRSVARPLDRLREGARRLSRGDMDTRIEIGTRDEFGVLAAHFNSMAASLKAHQQRLVHSEKLASVGRLAAGIAHELNNPLTVMLGYLMLHRRRAQGRLERDLWAVEQEALHCKQIVRELLELSRPAEVHERHPVDLRWLCEDVVTRLGESGQVALPHVDVHGSGTALGDESKLRQVIVNLVKNAAEAAGRHGRVSVRVTASPEAVEVAVSDDGPGIPPAARARVFEPFFTTKSSGTGLGLAVSRAIAVAHGGDIALRDGMGTGALFALTVPCAAEGRA